MSIRSDELYRKIEAREMFEDHYKLLTKLIEETAKRKDLGKLIYDRYHHLLHEARREAAAQFAFQKLDPQPFKES